MVGCQPEFGMLKEDPFARNLPKIIEIALFSNPSQNPIKSHQKAQLPLGK